METCTTTYHTHNREVSPWVRRFAPLIPAGGRVLDLACGGGRHTRYLAGRGHPVEAVDRNEAALAALAQENLPGLTTRCADLEGGPWPYNGISFAGIVVTNFLWRPLMPNLMNCLDKGGVLIYETFMVGNEQFGKPANPTYLLRKDELRFIVREHLDIIAFEQGEVTQPRPSVIQRICATRLGNLRLPE